MSLSIPYTGDLLAGVDEVGRGPLAGDVLAAAVILDPSQPILGLADSKKLSAKKREQLAGEIKAKACCWFVARASVEEIDQLNILWATMLAMKRAVDGLSNIPEFVVVDGNRLPKWHYLSMSIVKGDAKVAAISAAAIIAKVTRDKEMERMDSQFPGYGFAQHKGYGTLAHRQAIAALGPCPVHRKSFEPIKSYIYSDKR